MLYRMRLLLVLVFVFLVPGLARVLVDVGSYALDDPAFAGRVLGGVGLGAAVQLLILRRIPGYLTLQHETKHALVALLWLKRIHRFSVTLRQGGVVEYSGGFGGSFGKHTVILAPYYLLPLTVVAAAVRPLIPPHALTGHDIVFGALVAVELLNLAHDLRRNFRKDTMTMSDGTEARTDIGRQGYTFTLASVAFFGLGLLLLSASLMTAGYSGLPEVGAALIATWCDSGAWIAERLSLLFQ